MGRLVLAQNLLHLARAGSVTITTAESCTGGLLAGAITEIPGSSKIFERGFVTYSNSAKTQLLGVLPDTLQRHGAVSKDVAAEMAIGALAAAGADVAIAVTGIAGPGASENKPEGRVCFALVRTGQSPHCETVEFGAIGRSNVRASSVEHALTMLITELS